jgi:sugar phosphate isomerase/epimerase
MRLGGPVPTDSGDVDGWISALRARGYSAAYSPVEETDDEGLIAAIARAAESAGIVIAEVGAWSNPLSPDTDERRKAVVRCRKSLWVADRMGARCAVNIAGSRGAQWDGPDALNLTQETFDLVVESVRGIIDDVKPTRTFYTLEPMPWMYPDSPDNYLRLVRAVDRKAFGVHLDPVNMVNTPRKFYCSGELIRECFAKLGPYIRSCHAKDMTLSGRLTVHLDEARPGLGGIDYRKYLTEAEKLSSDTPVLLEHLKQEEDYGLAAKYVRQVAAEVGVRIK